MCISILQCTAHNATLTFVNVLALQHTPGDKHSVEALGETWPAWSDGLSVSVTPLRKTDIIGYEDTGEEVVTQIDLRPQGCGSYSRLSKLI